MSPALDASKNEVLNSRRACSIALALGLLSFAADCFIILRYLHSKAPDHSHTGVPLHGLWLIVFCAMLAWGTIAGWIRTRGRERVFLLSWFTYPALLNILAQQTPSWSVSLGIAALLGPVMAVLAALSLLLDPSI